MSNSYKYDAFISYSHSDCGKIAKVIQKGLENIGKPWYWIAKRNLTVFRDETSLSANPHLWENIIAALNESKSFILLASPLAANSKWIKKEIEWWINNRDINSLYIILVNGNIEWNSIVDDNDFNWETTISLPKILSKKFASEPLWADVKKYGQNERIPNHLDKTAKSEIIKIIAGIQGKEPREIESDELRRKRKVQSFLLFVSLIIVVLSFTAYILFSGKIKSDKSSKANFYIAQGNEFAKSNINKALWMYAYAYQENNDSITFKILENFYLNNTTPNRFYKVLSNGEQLVRDSLNSFFDEEEKDSVIEFLPLNSFINFSINDSIYFKLNRSKTSDLDNFISGKKRNLHFDNLFISNNQGHIYGPNTNMVYNERLNRCFGITNPFSDYPSDTPFSKAAVYCYDLKNGQTTAMIESINNKGNEFKIFDKNVVNADLSYLFQNGEPELAITPKNNLFIYPSFCVRYDIQNKIPIGFYIDFETRTLKSFKIPKIEMISDISFSPDERFIYYATYSQHGDQYVDHFLCRAKDGIMVKTLFPLDSGVYEKGSVATVHRWYNDSTVIYGTSDGKIVMSQDIDEIDGYFYYQVESYPDVREKITSIAFSDKFVIAGTENGNIKIWRNEYKADGSYTKNDESNGFQFLYSIMASPDNDMITKVEISRDSKNLMCMDSQGKIMLWDLKKKINLSKHPKVLYEQLKKLNIDSIDEKEKATFGIKENDF